MIKEKLKKILKIRYDGPYIKFSLFKHEFHYTNKYRKLSYQVMQESIWLHEKIDKMNNSIHDKLFTYNHLMRGIEKSLNTAFSHQENIKPFKNICAGKKVVVCGAGPSLSQYKPIPGAIHLALNRAFLYDDVNFDYIFVHDYAGIRDWKEELASYNKNCKKIFGITRWRDSSEISESYSQRCGAIRFYTDGYTESNDMAFDLASSPIGSFRTVALAALQFVLYMNPKTIYIVGCDCVNNGHFNGIETPENIIEGTKENYAAMAEQWKKLKQFAELYYPETEIISINPVGLKGLFKDIYTEN